MGQSGGGVGYKGWGRDEGCRVAWEGLWVVGGCLARNCARFRGLHKVCDGVGYGAPAFGSLSLIDIVDNRRSQQM